MKEELNKSDQIDLRKYSDSATINASEIIKSIVSNPNTEKDAFYLVDLEDICNKHLQWITRLPRVEPHYAIKCNTDRMLLKLLAYLGAGFDCASKNEIQQVLDMRVSPDRIIFANPCKQASYIKYAYKMGVDTMTFDNELELYKIKEHHKNAKVVLRIITNDENAVCRFSMKFGADMATAVQLIDKALELELDLIGVSFHVGSGQMSPQAFTEPILNARLLFDYALQKHQHRMYLLDLGGGYPGSSDSGELFNSIAKEINRALDEQFPLDQFRAGRDPEHKFRVIAEPGRYYACSAFTLCTSVIAKRVMPQSELQQAQERENLAATLEKNASTFVSQIQPFHQQMAESGGAALDASKSIMYYINDGVYASFNCLFYDHAECYPFLVDEERFTGQRAQKLFKSSIWGPTCDGLDLVVKECYLPELSTDDFMVFKNMGAYTLSGAVPFNGIPLARPIYVAGASWDAIKNAFVAEEAEEHLNMNSPVVVSNGVSSAPSAASCAVAASMAYSRGLSFSCSEQVESGATTETEDNESGAMSGDENGGCSSNASTVESVGDIGDINQLGETAANTAVDCAIEC